MKQKLIIAIDGYSSTGKSTLSKLIAKKMGYRYIDSGAMYRAITLYALEQNIIYKNKLNQEQLVNDLERLKVDFIYDEKTQLNQTLLNGVNVEDKIRDISVSSFVSLVAAVAQVREFCVLQQQQMGKDKAIVMDGRDIGTTVFPCADIKFFITASPEVRAKRRFLEYAEQNKTVSYQDVLNNVIERDKIDTTREHSPLKKAEDAIVIDNSQLTLAETLALVMQKIEARSACEQLK